MASVDTTNGQTRAAQISISSSQENPMCLGCSETVAVTKEPETALYLSKHGHFNEYSSRHGSSRELMKCHTSH